MTMCLRPVFTEVEGCRELLSCVCNIATYISSPEGAEGEDDTPNSAPLVTADTDQFEENRLVR